MDNKHSQQQQETPEQTERKEKLEEVSEIHFQSKPAKIWNTITSPEAKPLSQVFIDLMDMSKVATKKGNANHNFGLVAIDVYSRRGWIEPIKNKTTGYVLEGLKKIFIKNVPERITSDNGGEFKGQVSEYFRQNNIEHRTVQVGDHRTMGIIDRFIRTIRNELNLIWEFNENFEWVPIIHEVVDAYNKTYHNTIKAVPINVYEGTEKNTQEIYRNPLINEFPKGTRVRKELERTIFSKGDKQFSKTIFKVKGRKGFKVILSEEDLVRPSELLKTNVEEHHKEEEPKEQLSDKVKQITKEKKNINLLKSLDVKPENIRSSARIKKKVEKLDL